MSFPWRQRVLKSIGTSDLPVSHCIHTGPVSSALIETDNVAFMVCRQHRLRRTGDVLPTMLTTLALPPSSGVVRWLHQPCQPASTSQEAAALTLLGWLAPEDSDPQSHPSM